MAADRGFDRPAVAFVSREAPAGGTCGAAFAAAGLLPAPDFRFSGDRTDRDADFTDGLRGAELRGILAMEHY